ncbi:nucleoporin NUP145 precursor [Scheffersomyces xylosifermentans]|uniref:nucleoporin NUP145 precursor n=1 Tax=Scheffersomyces xylosifermentans TaxID=1304137 RepID=UPI00315DAEB5
MPESITNTLFAQDGNKEHSDRKRRFSYLEKKNGDDKKSSLLSKLGQTFRIFRNTASTASIASIRGLFTDSNYANTKVKQSILPKSTSSTDNKRVDKPTFRTSVQARRAGSMKRLVIKSKPLKYHLIDADKVFNSKRSKIVTNVVSSDRLLTERYPSDDDSDYEITAKSQNGFGRYPYNISSDDNNNKTSKSGSKVIAGESVKSSDNVIDEIPSQGEGYWSTPAISKLSDMTLEQLSAVENLIIGRIGYGQIAYNYPVDLSQIKRKADENGVTLENELFGKIFKMKKMLILLYTNEDEEKPPMGVGLNVPATVTLEGAKPKEGISIGDYIGQLKSQKGMEFVTYDPITYVWVCKVKHFSVWGLIEDDGTKESRKLMEMKRKQDEKEDDAEVEYSRIYENKEYLQEIKKQRLSNSTRGLPGGWRYNTTNQDINPLDIKRGIVTNEIRNQIDLYRNEQVSNDLTAHVSDITLDSEESDRSASPDSLVFADQDLPDDQGQKNFDYLKQLVSFLPGDVDMNEIVNEKAYEPDITNDAVFDNIQIWPNLATSEDWIVQLELANDMNSALTPYFGEDAGGRKQVSPSNVDEVLFSDFNRSALHKDQFSTPTVVSKLAVIDDIEVGVDDDIFPNNIPRIVYDLLAKSTLTSRSNSFPIIKETSSLKFSDFITSDSVADEKQLLTLGAALFDDISISKLHNLDASDPLLAKYLDDTERKRLFGEWLKIYNKKDIDTLVKKSKSNPLELIFVLVCSGDLQGAIKVALESNNSHLSVILTLTDSNDDAVKGIAGQQVVAWEESSSLRLIPKPVVKIYQILSGDLDEVVFDLPWNVTLALKLFYGDYGAKLHEIIKDSQDLFESSDDSREVVDILKFYSAFNTSDVNDSLKLIATSSLNSKLKWLYFKALGKDLGSDAFDDITTSFAEYLEKAGLWKEAIFVYSHLRDDKESRARIRSVVISSIKNFKDDDEEYLVKVLKIPVSLIFEGIAISKNSTGDHWGECEAYINAELWENAHSVITSKLGPSVVVTNNEESKDHLLKLVANFPQSGKIIPTWNSGAGIYENFILLLRNSNLDALNFLLSNIPLVKNASSFEAKSALKIISKKVGDIAIQRGDIADVSKKIDQLYLGEAELKYFQIRLQD